jgi:transglutaminase-like putative cysteine protease
VRFAVAHKAATYLVVGFAYIAMIAGGGVSSLVALGGFIALVASWWWEPPLVRFERWTWLWTTASVFALVYSVLTAIVTTDFLGVGAQFLTWLTVAKAFNRRAARDWQQMYLLAFLMLVAGSVLNPDLTYGACFLGFVISATWALTLFHLRREMEDNLLVKHAADRASERVEVRRILDSKRIVGARFFVGTGFLSFAVFLVSAIVFLALPRVGFGFFLKSHGGLNLVGFSDGVKLGGHGVLKTDSTVVMRVEVDSSVGNRDAPEIHWRGVAFDHYEKGEWSRTKSAPDTTDIIDHPTAGTERHSIDWRYARHDGLAKQEVWLDPLDSDVLFGASSPYTFEVAQVVRQRARKFMKNDELRLDHSGTIHYTVYSQLAAPTPDVLRAAHGPLPRGYEVYLQLPETEITPDTYDLAAKITAGLTTNYDKAVAIQRYLDANYTYTLELKEPGKREPVAFFLFDRKQGHCEYFASAFAVLARAAHVPVRQVNGFLGGEWNEYQGYVAVRAGDAHSWDEVYFPGAGWVTFDPTPSSTEGLGRGGTGWRAKLGRFIDTLRFQWTKWVIEYDLVAQLSLFKDIGSAIKRGALAVRDGVVWALKFWPVAALGAIGLAIVAVLRRRRGYAFAPARAIARARERSGVARIYDQIARQLAKAGIAREPATTPRELATRIAARPELPLPQLGELVDLYYAAEWGRRRDSAAERRAAELADQIRAALRTLPR